jgi:hypothetical protein
MRLSDQMTEALQRARRGELRRVHKPGPGKPPWPAHPATIAALLNRGLLNHSRKPNRHAWPVDTWTLTEAGHEALAPPAPRSGRDRVRFLADRSKSLTDYTSDPGKRIDDLEAVDPAMVDAAWFGAAAERHAGAADRRVAAKRVRRAA